MFACVAFACCASDRQDEHERLERLTTKKRTLKEQDEYETIKLDDDAEEGNDGGSPYGGRSQ